MRQFVVQVVVKAIALWATLVVLGLVRIPAPDPANPPVALLDIDDPGAIVVLGFVLALTSSLVRPALIVLLGRWGMRHPVYGVVFGNALVFGAAAVLAAVLEEPFLFPEPTLLWLFIDSLVFTIVSVVLDAALGFDRPNLESPERDRRLWSFLDSMPSMRRNILIENFRLFEVRDTLSRYGMEIAASSTPLAPLRRFGDRLRGRSSREFDAMSTPAKVRVMLQQLGPTFVKLGQMVSSRRELLGPAWSAELEKLQSTVPPFPWDVAKATIAAELGKSPEQLFGSVDETPLGAASLAQVHRGTLPDGTPVVIKVQRPHIQAKVRADLGVMQELAGAMEERFAMARSMGAMEVVAEFADGVLEELDYKIEAYNARRLADVLAPIEGVGVPRVYPALSSSRVIVMDFVPGVKASRADKLDPSVDREAVARTLIRALIKQMLIDGFFHGDPHPGNVMLDPTTGQVTFLDLGLMGELRERQRFDLLALVWALQTQDPGMLAAVARRLCRPVGPVDDEAFRNAVQRIFYRAWVYGDGDFGGVMGGLFDTLAQNNLRMRRELTLAIKAIMQAEELIRSISPGLPVVDALAEEAQGLLRDELGRRMDQLLHGDLAVAVRPVLAMAPTLGAQFIPALLRATGHDLPWRPSSGDDPDATIPADRQDDVPDRTDRLPTAVALAGLGITAALFMLAFFLRPTAELVNLDFIVLLLPLWIGIGLVITLRAWRIEDERARTLRDRRLGKSR